MIHKSYVISSMYFDGLSSVTGKESTWNTRKHRHAKTLAKSMTMACYISLVYSMINLWYVWCTSMHGLLMSWETLTVEVDWCFCFSWNLIYDIWCMGCFMCTWWHFDCQSINIRWQGWKYYTYKASKLDDAMKFW